MLHSRYYRECEPFHCAFRLQSMYHVAIQAV